MKIREAVDWVGAYAIVIAIYAVPLLAIYIAAHFIVKYW